MKYRLVYSAFQKYVSSERFTVSEFLYLAWSNVPAIVEWLIRDIPGSLGFVLRRCYYKFRLAHLGKSSLIDVGVYFIGPKNISIGDFTWIDSRVKLEATLGAITIGSRIHIASDVIIGTREKVEIGDYAAIAAGCRIYSNSEYPSRGLRMSGPMIPEKDKSFRSKPITIGKDAVVGTNSVLLPGANLQEGSILGALSLLNRTIPSWEIWIGNPAAKIGKREKVKSKA